MAVAAVPVTTEREFRPSVGGLAARGIVAVAIAALALAIPHFTNTIWDDRVSLAAIYAIIGLSVNVITGYAGQISLGHQAFVGIGAFMSAFFVDPEHNLGFVPAVVIAGATGALMALVLGLVALRIRGLYLALLTLSFGLMAEATVFNLRDFTGGGAGASAPRPAAFESNQRYAYLCLLFVGLFLLVDWRLARSKAGRAIVSVRNNERVASTLGVNATGYKLLAFVVGGLMAGTAGSLFAHWNEAVQAEDFSFRSARPLIWVLMAVVGGLGSRAGVVIGSAFFALFPYLIGEIVKADTLPSWLPFLGGRSPALLGPLLGAFLLLTTLTLYPGGIGQQLLPIRRWLAGGRFVEHHRPSRAEEEEAAEEAATAVADEEEPEEPENPFDEQGSVRELFGPPPPASQDNPLGDSPEQVAEALFGSRDRAAPGGEESAAEPGAEPEQPAGAGTKGGPSGG